MLTKQQLIMHHVVTNDTKALFCEELDEPGVVRRTSLLKGDWEDFGSPETITVTVVAGDILNTEDFE